MIKNIDFQDFRDAFKNMGRENNFTYEGQRALFDYLERLEEETGTPLELDVIALCCDYTEYKSVLDAYNQYISDLSLQKDTPTEEEALQWLNDQTQVIEFDGGIVIQNF